MNWSRTKLINYLMDEGMRGTRKVLRTMPTEWLIAEAVKEGAKELACPQCQRPFTPFIEGRTTERYECDTGLCAECQNALNDEQDAMVECPKCGNEFIP